MKILGQDGEVLKNQLLALILNIYSWLLRSFFPFLLSKSPAPTSDEVCVAITGPGGMEKLKYMDMPKGTVATVGYNLAGLKPPYATSNMAASDIYSPDHVLIKTSHFSVNYADVTIRWGLYESALRYVGYPIVPGFDFSGTVIWAGPTSGFVEGDQVFGCTLFGAYSSRILVPARQIRNIPKGMSLEVAAAVPAVAGTALHAVALAGAWPNTLLTSNKAVLIHSAAGGVGSMLIQICKLCGFHPVVAVVGASHKVAVCQELGADVVVDKSSCLGGDIWPAVERASPKGYIAVFDATGVETLSQSYSHLTQCGRLISYGFHSNLPKASDLLSPTAWLQMLVGIINMPKYDPMALVLDSKAVMGFNLSFFADEHILISEYLGQIVSWLESDSLRVAEVTIFDMCDIAKAHELIQSGMSVGKIVIRVGGDDKGLAAAAAAAADQAGEELQSKKTRELRPAVASTEEAKMTDAVTKSKKAKKKK